MSYKISVLQKDKEVDGLSLTYSIFKKDEIIEGDIYTMFDIEVQKSTKTRMEKCTCPSVSSDINTAVDILEILYRNDVLPETLMEVMEECLELV